MIMKYFEDKAHARRDQSSEDSRPSWVTDRNSSLKAWLVCEALRREKTKYIKSHHNAVDFIAKSVFQIKPSEVARAINLNRTTLMHTSTYSENFAAYIAKVNTELDELKVNQIKDGKFRRSRGSIRDNKDRLVIANKELKILVAQLEQTNVEKLVQHAFDQLPLPIKKKLGID